VALLGGQCAACLLRCALNLDADSDEPELRDTWRFGDYQLEEKITRGGMGVVCRARQLSLNRPVVLNMIIREIISWKMLILRMNTRSSCAGCTRHWGTGMHRLYFARDHCEKNEFAPSWTWSVPCYSQCPMKETDPRRKTTGMLRLPAAVERQTHITLRPAPQRSVHTMPDPTTQPRVQWKAGLVKRVGSLMNW
jgi:hypothetical protein